MLHSADRALSKALIFLFATLYFSSAHAEVTDKVPELSSIWSVAIASGVVCLVATYFRRWLALLLVFPVACSCLLLSEIHSPDMEPALLAEVGQGYFVQVYLAAVFVVLLGALGWFFNAKKCLG